MAKAPTESWIGSGPLNAIAIKHGANADLATLIHAMIETPGNEPGPVERSLRAVQDRALDIEMRSAARSGKLACSTPGASISGETERVGDAGQTVKVDFVCSAGEDCCQRGTAVANDALQSQIGGAQAAIAMNPLHQFQLTPRLNVLEIRLF